MQETDTLPCFNHSDLSQRKPAIFSEFRCGLEFNGKCNEQLEVFATFRGKLCGGYSQKTCLGSYLGGDRQIFQLDVKSASRSGGEMSGVAAETVAEIDHGMRTPAGKPLTGGNPRLRVGIALPSSVAGLFRSAPCLERSP
jgi:hypothetical protein